LQEILGTAPGPDRVLMHLPRDDGLVEMELGDRFRVHGTGPEGTRVQREIDALFGRPVWRLEVIRKKAPERTANGRSARALAASAPAAR
jgi:hypothetical protein